MNVLIEEGLDNRARLDGATEPASGQHSLGRSPSNSSLKRRNKDVENLAEKPVKETPGNLYAHEDLIKAYWKAKPKTKTPAAWKLLMTELTKIQDNYGDIAVRAQLELAEANRWQSITLANYERYGVSRSNAPAKGGVDWDALEKMGPMF